jgi:hypothetical protein
MEMLIFALITSYKTLRRQERMVSEPEEFQPFDLEALRNSANVQRVGQWHTDLERDGRSIPMNDASAIL